VKRWIAQTIATFFYLGYSPFAPGTVGTLGAIALFYSLSHFPTPVYILFFLGFTIISIWASGEAEGIFGKTDPGQVVTDEVCGYLVTMFLIPPSLRNIILGFLLFRFFDILKPPPTRQLERLPGGFGIVIDDVFAGIYSNMILQVVTRVIG
jgi:phosphatidylglycerophosphatase A